MLISSFCFSLNVTKIKTPFLILQGTADGPIK
jgi:hypothetical protein